LTTLRDRFEGGLVWAVRQQDVLVAGHLSTISAGPDDSHGVPASVTVERYDRLTTERLVTFREVPGTYKLRSLSA
jgi:hypothetical protein